LRREMPNRTAVHWPRERGFSAVTNAGAQVPDVGVGERAAVLAVLRFAGWFHEAEQFKAQLPLLKRGCDRETQRKQLRGACDRLAADSQ
jgi:hypothetical protein